MSRNQKTTGNPHTNGTRDSFNDKVGKLRMMGKSKKVTWDSSRRNRSI